MIPKVIHYCWFGGKPLPDDAKKCIESWKKYCPDYKLQRWDESNFDLNCCPYVKEAFDAKKWAFITYYVRLYALYNLGGVYMDTDVEVLKNLDPFLQNKGFSGFESSVSVPTGIMAAEKGNRFIADQLEAYKDKHLIVNGKIDYTTNVDLITKYCLDRGLILNNKLQTIEDFTFYPSDYFCPKDPRTYEVILTDNTYTIHHFNGSWAGGKQKFHDGIKKMLGPKMVKKVRRLFNI